MINNKVSEFIYKPILDIVDGYAIHKNDWTLLFKIPFFYRNYSRPWCQKYVKTIKRSVEEHRSLTSEKFQNRIDYVELSAFGIDYKVN
jgi:hypothetical protein